MRERNAGKEQSGNFLNWLLKWLGYGVIAAFIFNTAFLLRSTLFPDTAYLDSDAGRELESALGWFLGTYYCFRCLPKGWPRLSSSSSSSSSSSTERISAVQIAQHWVPFWVGMAFIAMGVTDGIWTYTGYVNPGKAFPIWPHIIYLARYPALLLAILCLPSRKLSSIARVRLVLDGLLVITALVTFSWYFILGPTFLEGRPTVTDTLVTIIYPLGDLLLCCCLFQLAITSQASALQKCRWLFLIGLVCVIISGIIDAYQTAHAPHRLESWLLVFECIGYILIALAVLSLRYTSKDRNTVEESSRKNTAVPLLTYSPFLQVLLPAVFIPAVIFLLLFTWSRGVNIVLAQGVYIGSIVLIVQLVVRQALSMRETLLYSKVLYRMQEELHHKNSRLEEQAKELTRAYEQQRMANELKDQFLLNVNHELRTPLTELYGYLELLHMHQGKLDQHTKQKFLTNALRGSEELIRLVNTVLDAIRSTEVQASLTIESVSVISMVKRAVDVFEPQKWQEHQLTLLVPEGLFACADSQCVQQVLCNLLSNALKYSPTQTAIEIGADVVAASGQSTESEVCVWVKDCGLGISAEDMPLLFEKFVRLPRDQASSIRGTGLGLYICRQLVEAMGGKIWVESAGIVGQGSRFCFTLPISGACK